MAIEYIALNFLSVLKQLWMGLDVKNEVNCALLVFVQHQSAGTGVNLVTRLSDYTYPVRCITILNKQVKRRIENLYNPFAPCKNIHPESDMWF